MSSKIGLDYQNVLGFVTKDEVANYIERAKEANKTVSLANGAGSEMLGWKTLPSSITIEEIKEINRCAKELAEKSDVVVVIGIGGSYIGARAVIDITRSSFSHFTNNDTPHIIWAGQHISEEYAYELKELLEDKEIGVIVISKSGTTLEPALAFRYIREIMEDKYGRVEAARRIVAITDETSGALRKVATEEGYDTFVIPNNVGGRFSVLTPVGLLPMAVAGIDIEELMSGAYEVERSLDSGDALDGNSVIEYAAIRTLMYEKGKGVELMATFEPKLWALCEWWKQLYGESEGKDGKGLYPSSTMYSTDLHSLGQYVQDGERLMFETFINIEKSKNDVTIKRDKDDVDGLNYIAGMTVGEVNRLAQSGVVVAHTDGGVPNITLTIPSLKVEYVGMLLYFFEYACAVSAYMINVNPFNQEGVEEYKRNMFALLGKEGFEKLGEELKERLSK